MSFRQSLRHYKPRNDGPVSGEDIRRITERYERMKLKKRLTAKGGKWLNASNEGRNEGRKKKCQACCPEPDESLCNNDRTKNNQRQMSSNESSDNNHNNHNDSKSNYLGSTNRNKFTKSNTKLTTTGSTYVSPYNQKRMRGQRAKKAADVTTTTTSGATAGEKTYTSVGCSPIQTEEWMKLQQTEEEEEVKDVISVHVIPKVKKHRRRKKPKSKSFSERELSALQSKKLNEIKGKYESNLNINNNNNSSNNNRDDGNGDEQLSASDSEYSYTGSSEISEESEISSPEYPDDSDYQDVSGEYVRSLCMKEEQEEEGEEGRIMEEFKMKYSESRVEDVVREEVQRNNAKVRYKIAKCSEEQEARMRKMKNKYDAMVQQYAPGGDESGDGDDCGSDYDCGDEECDGGCVGGGDVQDGKSSNRDTNYPEQYTYADDFEEYEDDFDEDDDPPHRVSSFQRTNSWVCNVSCQDESTDATI